MRVGTIHHSALPPRPAWPSRHMPACMRMTQHCIYVSAHFLAPLRAHVDEQHTHVNEQHDDVRLGRDARADRHCLRELRRTCDCCPHQHARHGPNSFGASHRGRVILESSQVKSSQSKSVCLLDLKIVKWSNSKPHRSNRGQALRAPTRPCMRQY
jgi:hypothetical protein